MTGNAHKSCDKSVQIQFALQFVCVSAFDSHACCLFVYQNLPFGPAYCYGQERMLGHALHLHLCANRNATGLTYLSHIMVNQGMRKVTSSFAQD